MARSAANCSPRSNSLIIWENAGNFANFGSCSERQQRTRQSIPSVFIEIPYTTEQGIVGAEQGIKTATSGNYFPAALKGSLSPKI
jgi:hypothetical protein